MGKKQERFRLLQKLDEAIDEGETERAVGRIKMLVKMSLPDLGDKAESLKEFEEKKEEKRRKKIEKTNEEAENTTTLYKKRKFKRKKYTEARRDYITSMWEKLWDVLSEENLIPE